MEEMRKLSAEELKELREQLKNESKARGVEIPEEGSMIGPDGEPLPEGNLPVEEEIVEDPDTKSINVTVADDLMSATVFLSVPADDELYSVEEIVDALRSQHVVMGIQTDVLMDATLMRKYEEEIPAAVGKDITPGVDGYIEFIVDMNVRKTPEIREDGTCDYTVVGKLTNVAAGDLIAVMHSPVQGEPGYNVVGGELQPKFAKEAQPLRGKYIEFNQETGEYCATIDGKISLQGNNVEILSVHEINHDLDTTTGTTEFYGDMIVNGNVEDGATIRAGRNVTINGTVSGGQIFAGGDVILTKGINGGGKGKISTRGSVFAEFIEYARIDAVNDVHANYILNSDVRAQNFVYADGTRGAVIGGRVSGLKGVEIKTSGNVSEPKTYIHAGFSEEDYQKYAALDKKEKEVNTGLARAVTEMSELLRTAQIRGVSPEQKQRIYELNQIKDQCNATLEEISFSKKELSKKMAAGANATITVHNCLYRNSIITIDTSMLTILVEEAGSRFICKNEEIVRRTIPRLQSEPPKKLKTILEAEKREAERAAKEAAAQNND